MISTGDHDQINVPFWDDFDTLVTYIHNQGMVADLILFSDAEATYGEGLNGDTPGRTQNGRYIRYALARLAGQINVIWCMANEYDYSPSFEGTDTEKAAKMNGYSDGSGYTAADAQMNDLGTTVNNSDPYFRSDSLPSASRVLSVHQHSQTQPPPPQFLWWNLASKLGANWFTSAIIQDHIGTPGASASGDVVGNTGIIANLGHSKPVVNDEYGYLDSGSNTRTLARNAIWAILMGGGYGTFGGDEVTACASGNCPLFSGDWVSEDYYGDISNLVQFMNTTSYWLKTTTNTKITVLGTGTRAYASGPSSLSAGPYVVYVAQPAASGASFKFNESSGSSCTTVDQLDPRTNALTHLGTKSGAFSITTPDTNDWVYHLYGGTCGQ